MIKIGPMQFNQVIALAPMEDVTDIPFRVICKRLGADIVYTEFTSSEAIIRNVEKAIRKITVVDEERPVGIQIFGGIEESMEEAARRAEAMKPDLIDINCGCWSKTHAMRGEGAGLLRNIPHFEQIVKSTVRATRLPVTVKTRLGWDDKSIVILDVARMVEQAGARALTVHCRTRCQGYKGRADWTWLEKVKKAVSIPVFGNGDVTSPQDVKAILQTGCDGTLIGRAAIANPWIFREAKHYLATGECLPPPTMEERIQTCLEHLRLTVEYRGLKYGLLTFRKYYAGYLRGLPHAAALRGELMQLVDFDRVVERLNRFIVETSAVGVAV